jgi:peptidoglycan hydrolase-like protein with peptidoglycan-binding domain
MTAPGTRRWLASWLSPVAAVVVVLALSGQPATADAAHAGAPLAPGAGFDRPLGSDRVRSVQRRLRALGDAPGAIDGRFGALTEAAVRRAQHSRGLVADGIVGPRTAQSLRARVSLAQGAGRGLPHGSDRVRSLQRQLRALGTHPGPIDGHFGPLTQAAVRRVQRAEELIDDGIVGPRTARRLADLKTTTPARQPRATQPRHTSDPARVFGGAHGRQTDPGGHNPANAVLMAVLPAIVVALLFAGGWGWHRRRRATPTAPSGPTAVDHRPKPASTDAPVAQSALAREPQAALAGHPAPAPRKGFAGLVPPATPNGSAERATPGPDNRSAARATPRPDNRSAARATPCPHNDSAARAAPRSQTHSATRAAPTVRAFGYVSVPAEGALDSAAGPQAQAIEAACAARGWTFVGGVREPEPAITGGLERPGLEHVLERFQRGEANCLVVAEVHRLTRSAVELGGLLDRLGRAGVRLLVLDLGIDTGTEGGQLAAGALIRVGGWEHERAAVRTGNGLTVSRAAGAIGRPASG